MAAALSSAHRRSTHYSDRDCRRAKELGILGGYRTANTRHGPLLPEEHSATSLERCARRRSIPLKRSRPTKPRKDSVRGEMRSLPLQQDSDPSAGGRSRWMLREGLHELLGQILGLDKNRGLQIAHEEDGRTG